MVKQGIKERRSSVRAKRVLSIEFQLVRSKRKTANKTSYLSTTEDMSLGGVSFYTDEAYRLNDVLFVHIVMSGVLDIFKGEGKVVRIEKNKTGSYHLVAVKFLDAKSRARKAKSYNESSKVKMVLKGKRRINL